MTTITHSTGVITPLLVLGWSAARRSHSLVHPVLGRTDPDVTLRPAGMRTGTLTMLFANAADAAAAEAVFAVAQRLTLADPDVAAVAMTFVVAEGDIAAVLDPETRVRWTLAVPFQEVAP